ncbi:hypothetical protein THASP1DRAFT_3770, partial [Thamnocephalis sphaerospora]
IVIVGGSYGGLNCATQLAKQARRLNLDITLVEPRKCFHHALGYLRAAVDAHVAEQCFIPVDNLPCIRDGTVKRLHARVTAVHAEMVMLDDVDGTKLPYDYLVMATGATDSTPMGLDVAEKEEALRRMKNARDAICAAQRILVVGGGPLGIELASEINEAYPKKQVTLVTSAPRLAAKPDAISPKLSAKVFTKLEAMGTHVILGQRMPLTEAELAAGWVTGDRSWSLPNGEQVRVDLMV